MVHDPDLLDRLSAFTPIRFDDIVYRTTRLALDPLTGSYAGGRWAPRDSTQVLYTSSARDGALAEITFHLAQLTPRPSKPVMVHRLHATTRAAIRLLRTDLAGLGVTVEDYESLNYARTQAIGAAVAFLECDGLIVPSARWPTDNVVIFMDNHRLSERLELEHSETVDWITWGRDHARL
jgi:RES domain-containing protein